MASETRCMECGLPAMPGTSRCRECTLAFSDRHGERGVTFSEYFEVNDPIVTRELLAHTPGCDWSELAFRCACRRLELAERDAAGRLDGRTALATLPAGIQMSYRVIILECEVANGGFLQWLTNRSGQHIHETLDDLLKLKAFEAAAVVQQVVRLNAELEKKYPMYGQRFASQEEPNETELQQYWEDMQTTYDPQFDELYAMFPGFDSPESPGQLLDSFLASNPELLMVSET